MQRVSCLKIKTDEIFERNRLCVEREQLVTNTTASSNSHVSWQMEDEQTCGGRNLQDSPAVSHTDVRGSVWGCSQSGQDKGHLHRFSCAVAAGEHRTSWAVHLRMSGNHWLVKSSFYPTHNAEAQTAQLQVYFLYTNEMLCSLPQPQLSETSVMASHTSRKKCCYTSREISQAILKKWQERNPVIHAK